MTKKETLEYSTLDYFKDSISGNYLYRQKNYQKIWDVLKELGYEEKEIKAVLAKQIRDEKNELIAYEFYMFFDNKVISLREKSSAYYNVIEYNSPVIRKQIVTTYRKNNGKSLTLFFQDGSELKWPFADLYVYDGEIEEVNETILKIYNLY